MTTAQGASQPPPLGVALDSGAVFGAGQGTRLDLVFWASAIASIFLLTWSTGSTSINSVEPGVLSMARLLPPTYWAGFALLLASTIIWYFGSETKDFHFLLVPLWMGYVYLGPELMEVHPRGFSSYGHLWGVAHVLAGRVREFPYSPWLGFHYIFAMLTELTEISYLGMMRVGLSVLYLALAAGFIILFKRVLPDKKSIMVASLAALAMVAVPGGVGFTPHQMALILMLFGLYLLARRETSPVLNRLTFIGLFFAIVITHGLSAVVVVYVTAVAACVRWQGPAIDRQSPSIAFLPVLLGTIFVAWLLYSSDFWFPTAIRAFRDTVLREPIAFLSPFNHVTPNSAGAGRPEVSALTFAFLAVLLVWLLSVVARSGFWNGLHRDRLFPLLVAGGLPILITGSGNFSFEGFIRVFFYATPFLAWFLARESAAKKSTVVFLLLLLGLGFVLLYSREFEELPTSQQFAGAAFLVETAGPDVNVLQGDCYFPGALTGKIDAPLIACPREADNSQLAPDPTRFAFIVLSEFGQRTASFAFGTAWFEGLHNSVQGEGFMKIYSSGRYDVFGPTAPGGTISCDLVTLNTGDTVSCRASLTGTVTSTTWSAPNGSPSRGIGPTFFTRYESPGNQTVTLKACNVRVCVTLSQKLNVIPKATPDASGR